jgi:hypothetical protein
MDAQSIVTGWKERLVAMADNPPYVFRDTPHALIEQHYRRLTTFAGYSEGELVGAEERLGVRFPAVFRAYLLGMGKSPGDLFRGSEFAGIADFERFRGNALALVARREPNLALPHDAVVFLFHQGYTFVYLRAAGGFDGPTFQYIARERELREVAPTFAHMVDAELRLMENNNRRFREQGCYYMMLYPEGGASTWHGGRERPLDKVQ